MIVFLIPSIPGWEGDPDRHSLAVVSLAVSIVLLAVYVAVTWLSLRRHRELHVSDEAAAMAAWSLRLSLLVLGAATLVTALVAEILVGSLEVFAEAVGLSEFFVAAVIVAIVGNAAEHGGAVVIARRGNIKLAAEIALASSAQVAVFLIPLVAIISWAIDPLSLAFRPVELGSARGRHGLDGDPPARRPVDHARRASSSSPPTGSLRSRSSWSATATSRRRGTASAGSLKSGS